MARPSFDALRTALLLLAVAALPANAQEAIAGRITDAEDGAPIDQATVVVLDESASPLGRAITDQDGSYRVELAGPGVYLVAVQLTGFADVLSDPLTVGAGETLSYDLSMTRQVIGQSGAATEPMDDTEFLSRYIAETCAGVFIPGLHGIVFGAVRNEGNGEPLSLIEVSAQWNDGRGFGSQTRATRSDESAFWYICDLPAGETVSLRAVYGEAGIEGEVERVQLTAGTMRNVDLTIPLSLAGSSGNLIGTVRDVDSSRPVIGAVVRLQAEGRTTTTNDRGLFIFEDVPAGLEVLEVEMLGYADILEPIQVYGGRSQQLEVLASREPLELDPILVTVRPRNWFLDRIGIENRMRLGLGAFLLREDIEARPAAVNLGDMMRAIPGVRVRRTGGGIAGGYQVQLRQAANIANQACTPAIWVDGNNLGPDASLFRDIITFDIEAIEVYRGAAQIPAQFGGMEARCGVVVVWTRRGFGSAGVGR